MGDQTSKDGGWAGSREEPGLRDPLALSLQSTPALRPLCNRGGGNSGW